MFTDLRGFTTFAEQLAATAVIGVLNRYLSRDERRGARRTAGRSSSYIGDGMMAVFGAPIELADHADRALAAAREMLEGCGCPRSTSWLREEGYEQGFKMGIGVNSGPLHVRQRRLRAAARVHGDRRHDQHRVPHRGA